jgi:DNA-binding SARP family transcriptional activator
MMRYDAHPSGRDKPASEVTLHMLGSWGLRIGGVPAQAPAPAQKMLALLALRGPASRACVAGTLWPEVAEAVAFARLRTALWRLAGLRWIVDDQAGDLALAASVRVDVHRMSDEARCLRTGAGDVRGPEVFEKDLLPQWCDDWLIIDRERIRQTRLHALETLSALRLAQGRLAEAVDAALAAVRADPLRESAHRAVIAAHLSEGNICEAIRQFRDCHSLFLLELGVEPTDALSSLLPSAVLRYSPPESSSRSEMSSWSWPRTNASGSSRSSAVGSRSG